MSSSKRKHRAGKHRRAAMVSALPVEYLAVRSYLEDLREEIHPYGDVYQS